MERLFIILSSYFSWLYLPRITFSDVLDIIIIAYFLYKILLWLKKSRAWTLLKGIVVIALFMLVAELFHLSTILFIAKNAISVGIIALIILFQPELRRALDELGRKRILRDILNFGDQKENKNISDETIDEIVRAAVVLGKAKTGALIVLQRETPLGEYISTGIDVDSIVTAQMLVNIFEKNTPLHDGAVIISNNRIVAATCYLPLSEDNSIDKELGTRHRAALGISEVSDSVTVVVSEETGRISITYDGFIYEGLSENQLKNKLSDFQDSVAVKKVNKKGGQDK